MPSPSAGSLELGWLTALPLRGSAPQVHILPLLSDSLLPGIPSSVALPSLAAATGERRCHLSRLRPALRRRRASSRYARPFSFLLLCEMDGAPQTLTKLFVFGSESSYNILPTGVTSISFAKIIDVLCWVRPCCSTWFSERAQGAVMQRLGDFRLPPFFNYPPYFT